jgi:plasmid replication initiation protein
MVKQKEKTVEKQDIMKPSGLVQITNKKVSLLQRKAFNVLIFNAYEKIDEEYQEISINELRKYLSYNDFQILKNEILNLMGTIVEFNYIGDRDKTIWQAYALLPFVEIDNDTNTLKYSFGPFRHKLKEPEFYARINLEIQKKFKSKYTLALYEFCCDHFIRQKGFGVTPWLPLDDLVELLGYEGEMNFSVFNRDVLKKAVKEINTKSDIKVSYKFKRRNKTVFAVQFLIYPDEQNKILKKLFKPEQQELPTENSELYNRLVNEFKVNELLARDILKRFNVDHIEESLFYIAKRKEKIKNLGAYTYTMITNEKMKLITPTENKEVVEIPDGAIIEIDNQKYTFSNGMIQTSRGVIPLGKLQKMVTEGKAKIV